MLRLFLIVNMYLYTSLGQAEFVELDDAELSESAAQGSIFISLDAGIGGAKSEITFSPEGGDVAAFSEIQTFSRNKSSGVMTDAVRAPINVVVDVLDDAIVAAIDFGDLDGSASSSTALKIGAWKLAPTVGDIGTAPSMGALYLTDVTGSAVVTIGLR